MNTSQETALWDTDISAPSILVVITEEEPERRIPFFATRKTEKGAVSGASFILGLPVMDIPTNKRAATGLAEGERLYLPKKDVGKDKNIKRFELPTEKDLANCRNVFEENEDVFGETFPGLMKTLFGE